jgi:hypothetical protein
MPETPENLLESPQVANITFGPVGAVVIASFAAYGAVEAGRNVYSKAKQIRDNRKAKKAEKQAVEANNPPTQ